MNFWEMNLQLLRQVNRELAEKVSCRQHNPRLAVDVARNGLPVIRLDGIYLNSGYDPQKEAADWLKGIPADKSQPITLAGIATGYHLQTLAEAGFHGTVIENDISVLTLAMESLDLQAAIRNFEFIIGRSLDQLRRSCQNQLAGEIHFHPASLKNFPEYYGKLQSFAMALKQSRKGGLRIMLLNPVYGGSLPAAKHSAAALESLGHEVRIFEADKFSTGMSYANSFRLVSHRDDFLDSLESFLSRGIELMASEFEPDLVISLAQAPVKIPTLNRLESMGIPSAFWFVEDYRVLPYWRRVASGYSYFFSIQQGEIEAELEQCGVKHHSYLPTAAAPEIHSNDVLVTEADTARYGSPLSFVGAGYYNRQRFFRGLTDYDFKIWGSDWPLQLPLAQFIQDGGARIDTATCVKIFNSSAVNLNLHSSLHHEGIDPEGDFVNPRTFELASCGAFQLVDRRSLMPALFADDELVIFEDINDLRNKIDHYLVNRESREDCAAKGRKRVLSEHTYKIRMEELLACMIESFPIIAERQNQRLDATESIIAQVRDHEGMHELLMKLDNKKRLNLDGIYQVIEENQGLLTRTEKIFLMLKNIEIANEVSR